MQELCPMCMKFYESNSTHVREDYKVCDTCALTWNAETESARKCVSRAMLARFKYRKVEP